MELPINYTKLSSTKRREVRNEYVRRQKGKCAHCGKPLDGPASDEVMSKKIYTKVFPPGFMNRPVHLHHCHNTGMTIGAIHCHCNAVLWLYHGA